MKVEDSRDESDKLWGVRKKNKNCGGEYDIYVGCVAS